MLGVDPTVEVLVANQVLEVEVLAKVLQAVAAKVVVAVVPKVAVAYLEIVSLVATPVPQGIHFSSYHSLAVVVATVVMAVVYRFSK